MSEQNPPTTPGETAADAGGQRQMHLSLGIVFIMLGGSSFYLYENSLRFIGLPFLVIGLTYLAMAVNSWKAPGGDHATDSTPPPPSEGDRP
ncbi:hypothetical protein OVN20_11235 [Microcella daejeonensis]|uniref:hypothetical protein n=1 Tax=Microcella daejeonensis TaxID=2994971 RepID=UPI00226D4CFA|nr:hypothetical protein [Microcella daejeonensis]WAB83614.1 hypothetical protein OVN20_11235 [Microcella daejeonensis]